MLNTFQEAKRKYEAIERNRNTRRFKNVVGRLIAAKLFRPQEGFAPIVAKLKIADYLWAGQWEPRILEVLVALIIKRPSFFKDIENCPADLLDIAKDVKRGQPTKPFRGVPARSYLRWVSLVGHKGVEPSQLKSFRFKQADLVLLRDLTQHGYSEIGAIREGLKLLQESSR